MLETILRIIKRFIPKKLFRSLQPIYHWKLALLGALIYRFPSRHIAVIGVTGTKGKSTTVELVNAILEAAGYKTALLGTIRFKVGDQSEPNKRKMTIPGRFFIHKFIRRAVDADCDYCILELTSEGAKQYRHKWIALDALIFTNLSPEHIESHGSYEKYRDAKLSIARSLIAPFSLRKKFTTIVANADDPEGKHFLAVPSTRSIPYSLEDAKPYTKTLDGHAFTFEGTNINLHLPGLFNLSNALAAATLTRSLNVPVDAIRQGLEGVTNIRGRVEFIREGQPFDVIVDYAHTSDSLRQFYDVFKGDTNICILGNTGGGRDTWKRPEMAKIAETACARVILTNEDPYDEDPSVILEQMAEGITDKKKLTIIMDRRAAIAEALRDAAARRRNTKDGRINVLITGKGTDPFIMGPNGTRQPWDDARVVREELAKIK